MRISDAFITLIVSFPMSHDIAILIKGRQTIHALVGWNEYVCCQVFNLTPQKTSSVFCNSINLSRIELSCVARRKQVEKIRKWLGTIGYILEKVVILRRNNDDVSSTDIGDNVIDYEF